MVPRKVKVEREFPTNFQFVANDDLVSSRKSIRKHVMQEYRRRERWARGESTGERNDSASSPSGKRPKISSASSSEETDHNERWEVLDDCFTESPSLPNNALPLVAGKRRRLDLSLSERVTTTYSSRVPYRNLPAQTKSKDEKETDDAALPFCFNPWAAVAAADADPFHKINFGAEPAMQALLHQCKSVEPNEGEGPVLILTFQDVWNGPRAFDLYVAGTDFHRVSWLYSELAAHDPEPLHVCIGFALRHMAQLRGQKEPPLAIEHRAKALRAINKRLDDPNDAVSDACIGAVINLAGHEVNSSPLSAVSCTDYSLQFVYNHPKFFATHMSGLARMIKARGGVSWFNAHPELRSVIMRCVPPIIQTSPRSE